MTLTMSANTIGISMIVTCRTDFTALKFLISMIAFQSFGACFGFTALLAVDHHVCGPWLRVFDPAMAVIASQHRFLAQKRGQN